MLRLMHPNGALEWRYIPLDFVRIGVPRIVDCEVEATTAHASSTVAATAANRVEISDDNGSTFTPLGVDVTSGFDLGVFTPGQRKAIKLRVKIPTGPAREELVGIEFGVGT